jgi:hypothetical protein
MGADLLQSILALCGPDAWPPGAGRVLDLGGLPLALFVAGLIGGVTHCAGMCGPFVLSQVAGRLDRGDIRDIGEWGRLKGAALVPYHLGRFTTYTLLGLAAGGLAQRLVDITGFRGLLLAFLAIAAGVLLAQALALLDLWRPAGGQHGLAAWITAKLAAVSRPFAGDPTGWNGYPLGVALGFLPCGLLYGALAAAAGSGSAAAGAAAMAAFILGTVPGLIGVGYAGAFFGRAWLKPARVIAAPLLLVNAAFIALLAARAIA